MDTSSLSESAAVHEANDEDEESASVDRAQSSISDSDDTSSSVSGSEEPAPTDPAIPSEPDPVAATPMLTAFTVYVVR